MASKPKQVKNTDCKRAEPSRTDGLRSALLAWYRASCRDLPWRRTRDPYAIWVSEIMLQQTRVNAVLEHYREFLERFPSVEALAAAEIDEVLAAWSGLGYYRRARSMHEAAKVVVREHSGTMPNTREGLLTLPGIGRYTSAAIASIAFGEPHAVVDGNVERVLARVDGETRSTEEVWSRAEELLDRSSPGDWNQAMMELGATVCTPVSPTCLTCPVSVFCKAPGADTREAQPDRRRAKLIYGLAVRSKRTSGHEDEVYLAQRGATEKLMPMMWELPQLSESNGAEVLGLFRHSITNTDYEVEVVRLRGARAGGGQWFRVSEASKLALTGVARKVLTRFGYVARRSSR